MISYAEALSRAKATEPTGTNGSGLQRQSSLGWTASTNTSWKSKTRAWTTPNSPIGWRKTPKSLPKRTQPKTAQPLTRLPASTTKRKRLTMMPSSKRTTKHGLNLNGNAKTTDKPKSLPPKQKASERRGFGSYRFFVSPTMSFGVYYTMNCRVLLRFFC